jgi:hypothetical protein
VPVVCGARDWKESVLDIMSLKYSMRNLHPPLIMNTFQRLKDWYADIASTPSEVASAGRPLTSDPSTCELYLPTPF